MSFALDDLKTELFEPGRIFSVQELKRLVDEIHDEHLVETHDSFHHRFFYEICPLLAIASCVGSDKTAVVVQGGPGSRIDGQIRFDAAGQDQKVELTGARDGRNDTLQMELLKETGRALAFQEIDATGTKRNRDFGRNETRMTRASVYDREVLLPLMNSALARKKNKAGTNVHYAGSWLGIAFDDWVMPSGSRKVKRFNPLCVEVIGADPESFAPFSRVFSVGVSREYLFDAGTVRSPHR